MQTGGEQLGGLGLADVLAGAMRPDQLSSGRFRDLLDALPAAIYTTDAEGALTYFNPACIELSGRTPTLGGDHWCVTWKLYHPDGTRMPHDTCPMAVALKEGRVVRGAEAIAERPDGTRIWFTPYPTPLRDSSGRIVGGVNMLVDITGRKRAELSQSRLAAIVESSDDAIISKNLDSIITSWNRGAERIFGYTAEEAIGQSVTMLMPPDRVNEEPGILDRIRRGERIDHYETIRRRRDGTLLDVSLTVSPVRDGSGKVVGASKIARDITDRKRHEEALRQGERKLQRVLETDAVAVLFFDYRGTVIGANDVFLRMTGYRREQIDRRELTWRAMTPPEWVEVSERQMEQFARVGRIGPYEKEYFLADGSRRWMRLAGRDLGDGTIAELCIDITEGKLREADSRVLAALGSQMVSAAEPQAIYEKIMDAAVSLMRSDFASMQVFHPDRGEAGELELLAQRGFNPEATKFWKWVSGKSTCVCGLTLRDGARVVIPDASTYPRLDDGQKKAYRDAGIAAMQSTPLISRGGRLLGMVSTHWRSPHQPTESELSNFDILARQAADIIERRQSERQTRSDLEAMTRLQQVAALCARSGVDRKTCLAEILDAAIAITAADKGNIQLLDESAGVLRIAVQRGFDARFLEFFENVAQDEASACGAALKSGERMIVRDVTDSDIFRGRPSGRVLLDAGVRAVVSTPLLASDGSVLGMISTHFSHPRAPGDRATRLLDLLARQAADYLQARRAEEAVRQAKEEAEAANIAKDNFLATLSHELRTPLTPVLATLSSWEARRSFPQEFADDLELIRRNVDLETRLIDDLLDLTRIAKGKISLNLEVLEVHRVIDSVVAMYLGDIRAKRIDLSVHRDAGECYVRVDPGRLQQSFWNVLKNAVKFTPEGGRIEIATRTDQHGRVQVVFTDTGVGMTPDMLRRLFQPFEQETAGLYGGLGLGLAITRTLLEAQNGTIEARSDGPGQGAGFIITLPCVSKPIAAAANSPAHRKPERRPADAGYRVLLIEDHVDTARVLARLFAVNGHQVTTTHSIAEALAALRVGDFDVLVSDIGLPDGTGMDLISAVRTELCKKTPAVALTGFGMDEDVRRTIGAGFDDHLTKPVNLARLEQTIRRACKREAPVDGAPTHR